MIPIYLFRTRMTRIVICKVAANLLFNFSLLLKLKWKTMMPNTEKKLSSLNLNRLAQIRSPDHPERDRKMGAVLAPKVRGRVLLVHPVKYAPPPPNPAHHQQAPLVLVVAEGANRPPHSLLTLLGLLRAAVKEALHYRPSPVMLLGRLHGPAVEEANHH